MRRFIIHLLVLLPLAALILRCANDYEEVVARIGSSKIYVDELESKLREEFPNKPFSELTMEEKRQALEQREKEELKERNERQPAGDIPSHEMPRCRR